MEDGIIELLQQHLYERDSSVDQYSSSSRVGYGDAHEENIYRACTWVSLLIGGGNATFL